MAEGFQLRRAADADDEVAEGTADEAALLHVGEEGEEGCPVAVDVVEHHALAVVADGGAAHDMEHLVHGADAAGEGDDEVALAQHDVLAVAEVVAVDDVGGLAADDVALHELRGHHAEHGAASLAGGAGHGLHQP